MSSLTVTPTADPPGIRVVDRVSAHRIEFHTPSPVAPEPVGTDDFEFPVERAVAVRTERLTLPTLTGVIVRSADGRMLDGPAVDGTRRYPPAEYYVEVSGAIKAYLRVEAALSITGGDDGIRIDFGRAVTVVVAVRSKRRRPARTITTTTDGPSLLRTLDLFSAALRSTSSERAYPTLRGHPPEVRVGDRFSAPAGTTPAETGIGLELPPEVDYAFPAASLAYYLGATVEPASRPRLTTVDGFELPLDAGPGYEPRVERVLKRCLLLDSLVATEGHYDVELAAREALEPSLDLDPGALYDRAPHERLEAYMRVPFEAVREHVPEWPLTAYVERDPARVAALPYLVDDLALVRVVDPPAVRGTKARPVALDAFTNPAVARSAGEVFAGEEAFVDLPEADSASATWVGDGIPLGADAFLPAGVRHRHRREPSDGTTRVALVCNAPEMAAELDAVSDAYGSRAELPFDVAVHRNVGVDALAAVIGSDVDFLHYVGHATPAGLDCVDGTLDVADLDAVGADAFVLNACQSYRQGVRLVEGGSVGGAVALSDVDNEDAIDVGLSLARLLNAGFPLRVAIRIARRASLVGGQYLAVGDGSVALAQIRGGTAFLVEIVDAGEPLTVECHAYPTPIGSLGSLVSFEFDPRDRQYLNSGSIGPFELPAAELDEWLAAAPVPVRHGESVYWSDDVSIPDLVD